MLRGLGWFLAVLGMPAAALAAERATVTVLATTDMHGYVYPYDYFTRQAAARGLASVATLVGEVRRETPHTLLVDCGDTIQGSPLVSVYQAARRSGASRGPEPMMLAMNRLGYDAMAVGNHEFNFGLESLAAARSAARFPWLSANTVTDGRVPAFAPYLVKTVGGVKVAVIGLTTPSVPEWEKKENIPGLSWLAPEEGVRRALEALRAQKPDLTLVAMHSGLGPPSGQRPERATELLGENAALAVAERFPGLAAVIFGHSHQRDPGRRAGNVLLVQPKNWAADVARLDFVLEREAARGRLPHRVVVERVAVAALGLGVVHRDVGVAQQRVEVVAVARIEHDADRRRDEHFLRADRDRLALVDLDDAERILDRPDLNGECGSRSDCPGAKNGRSRQPIHKLGSLH